MLISLFHRHFAEVAADILTRHFYFLSLLSAFISLPLFHVMCKMYSGSLLFSYIASALLYCSGLCACFSGQARR